MLVAEGGGLIVLVLNGGRYHKLQVVFFSKKNRPVCTLGYTYFFINIWYHQVPPPTCSAKKREAKDGPLVICKKPWL